MTRLTLNFVLLLVIAILSLELTSQAISLTFNLMR